MSSDWLLWNHKQGRLLPLWFLMFLMYIIIILLHSLSRSNQQRPRTEMYLHGRLLRRAQRSCLLPLPHKLSDLYRRSRHKLCFLSCWLLFKYQRPMSDLQLQMWNLCRRRHLLHNLHNFLHRLASFASNLWMSSQ